VRGGTIVGVHDVIFAGEDEVIEFTHTAYSKSVFAKGAIEAAKFLAGKSAGMYDMSDVIAARNGIARREQIKLLKVWIM
jgi:4-hydroxy-tetrahydrodipicolinate reductase